MKKPNEIDPKEYETVFVNRQVRAANGRKLEVGKGHKNLSEKEFKELRNIGAVCTEKEGKEAAKIKAKKKELAEATKPMAVAGAMVGGDASKAAIAECKRIADLAVERCDAATEQIARDLEAFKADLAKQLSAHATAVREEIAVAVAAANNDKVAKPGK